MAIVFANLGTAANPDINDNSNATSYVNSSWTPPTTGIIEVWVHSRRSGGPDTPTMSGNSLTWTQIGSTFDLGGNFAMSLFFADASGSAVGATTVDFGANTQVGCFAHFGHRTGVDISGGLAAAAVQQPTNSGSADNGTITFAAAGDAANRMSSCHFHQANETTTGDGDWTDQDNMSMSGPASASFSQYRTDATDLESTATWVTSANWGGMGVELLAESDITLEQEGYRWRNDDGSESAATFPVAQDTTHSIAKSTILRLRALVNATGDPDTTQFTLEYKENGDDDAEYRKVPLP